MSQQKYSYGIYLGSNKAICYRIVDGVPCSIKTDTLSESLPCSIYFTRKGNYLIGDRAKNLIKSDCYRKGSCENGTSRFIQSMGMEDIYHFPNMSTLGLKADYTSTELLALFLKEIMLFISDDVVHTVAITVPPTITNGKMSSLRQATKLAGIDQCNLIMEPIAASIAYDMSSASDNSFWMSFEFEEDAFKTSLLKKEDGIMQVFDTDGDIFLSGNNLDYEIVDSIIIPYLKENFSIDSILSNPKKKGALRDAMKPYAEMVKKELSFKESAEIISSFGELGEDEDGEEIELDLTVTRKDAFNAMRPHFQKAVNICKTILARNNMSGASISKLILAGGSTSSPLIQQMLEEQVTQNIDTSIDPKTAIATGAALYALSVDPVNALEKSMLDKTIKLNIGYNSCSVNTTEFISVILDKAGTGPQCPDKIWVEISSADKSWSSGKVAISEFGDVFELPLQKKYSDRFLIVAFDSNGKSLKCEPTEITLYTIVDPPTVPLPYYIGTEKWDKYLERYIFVPIEGLEKNKTLPAIGLLKGIKTTSRLYPGNANDKLVIPIYEANVFEQGVSARLFEYVADIEIDGTDVNEVIPEGTSIEITIMVDRSSLMSYKVKFLSLDIVVSKEFNYKINSRDEISKSFANNFSLAELLINTLKSGDVDTSSIQANLEKVRLEGESNNEIIIAYEHQKEILREIEKLHNRFVFGQTQAKLLNLIKSIEEGNNNITKQTQHIIDLFHIKIKESMIKQDLDMAKELLDILYNFKETSTISNAIDECNLFLRLEIENGNSANDVFACVFISDESRIQSANIKFVQITEPHWQSNEILVNNLGSVIELQKNKPINIYKVIAELGNKAIKVNPNIIAF